MSATNQWAAWLAAAVAAWTWVASASAAEPPPGLTPRSPRTSPYRTDRILVLPKPGVSRAELARHHAAQGCDVLHTFGALGGLQVVHLLPGRSVLTCLGDYQRSGHFVFAEPDYWVYAAATPNDPKYLDGTLWGLHNTGAQSGSVADADIDAPEAWDVLNTASGVVVAVVDTGIRSTHEDLAANMWTHPTTGAHGVNTVTNTNDSSDDNGHGTLVAGILGAVGNNGKGVAGVAWRVQLMACKALDQGGLGSDSTLIGAIEYARTNGARIINASLDSPSYSQALSNAIAAARAEGILLVASAGNNGINVDLNPRYPACYDLDNVVSVGYSTRADGLGQLSNYGATNVDLVAPGEQMYSTFFRADADYFGGVFLSGTSLAAPYVSGALALLIEKFPGEDHRQLIQRLLNATDRRPALAGKVASGGRLNLREALSPSIRLAVLAGSGTEPARWRLSAGPNRTCVVEASPDLFIWSPFLTNTTSASGTFDFSCSDPPAAGGRFFRASSAP